MRGGKTTKKRRDGKEKHAHTQRHTAKEPKEEGGAQIKSAPNQVDFLSQSLPVHCRPH